MQDVLSPVKSLYGDVPHISYQVADQVRKTVLRRRSRSKRAAGCVRERLRITSGRWWRNAGTGKAVTDLTEARRKQLILGGAQPLEADGTAEGGAVYAPKGGDEACNCRSTWRPVPASGRMPLQRRFWTCPRPPSKLVQSTTVVKQYRWAIGSRLRNRSRWAATFRNGKGGPQRPDKGQILAGKREMNSRSTTM